MTYLLEQWGPESFHLGLISLQVRYQCLQQLVRPQLVPPDVVGLDLNIQLRQELWKNYGTLPWTKIKPDRQKSATANFIFHGWQCYSCPDDWNGFIAARVTSFYISSNVSITSYCGHFRKAVHWTRPVNFPHFTIYRSLRSHRNLILNYFEKIIVPYFGIGNHLNYE